MPRGSAGTYRKKEKMKYWTPVRRYTGRRGSMALMSKKSAQKSV